MEDISEFLSETFKASVDFSSITKADLRAKYMEKNGLSELNKEEKKLFSSAVNKFLVEIVIPKMNSNNAAVNQLSKDKPSDETSKNEEECSNGIIMKGVVENAKVQEKNNGSDSDSENVQEKAVGSAYKKKSDKKIYSDTGSDESEDFNFGAIKDICESSENENVSLAEIKSEKTGHLPERSINSSNRKNSKIIKNDVTNSESEDEPLSSLQNKSTEKMSASNKTPSNSSDKDDGSENEQSQMSDVCSLKKKDEITSSESEDEPLSSFQKKSSKKSVPNKRLKSSRSVEYDSDDSDYQPIQTSRKQSRAKKRKQSDVASSESEDEPLSSLQNKSGKKLSPNEKIHSNTSDKYNGDENKQPPLNNGYSSNKKKDENTSSESENEPLSSFQNKSTEMSIPNKKLKNSRSVNCDSDDSDYQPIQASRKQLGSMKSKQDENTSSESEDEPLSSFQNKSTEKSMPNKKLKNSRSVNCDSDDSDYQPIQASRKQLGSMKSKQAMIESDVSSETTDDKRKVSSSENESDVELINLKKELSSKQNKRSLSTKKNVKTKKRKSDESNEKSKTKKSKVESEDKSSEGSLKKHSSSENLQKNSSLAENMSSDSSILASDDEVSSKKQKKENKKKSGKVEKISSASEAKIEHLKKYVRTAGIRVNSYPKLFENCQSVKSKVEKLMELLQKEGLKGRPTLEKCKKLKKKIETKKEIAELDVTNILQSQGRPKRGLSSNNSRQIKKSPTPLKKFSRLQDIVDSEESD